MSVAESASTRAGLSASPARGPADAAPASIASAGPVDLADLVAARCTSELGWRLDADDVWICAGHQLARAPAQGWKLHVSAMAGEAHEVLTAALQVLAGERVAFKVLASVERLAAVNRGDHGRAQVGKFLTVYPGCDDQAVRLAVRLDQATRGHRGPRVPSDRRLRPDSVVSYRYGAFEGRWMQTPIGEVVPALESPDGTLVPDHRARLYVGPSWVDDPFETAGVVEVPSRPASLVVSDRYLLASVLGSSAEGSVHLALDLLTGDQCVVKRARGDAGAVRDLGPVDRLCREADLLDRLADEPAVPDLVELFAVDEDLYLVMERVAGTSLEQVVHETAAAGRHLATRAVLHHAEAIATVVQRLHARGYLHGDLKPPHVFVTGDGHGTGDGHHDGDGVRLVDVESLWGPEDHVAHQVLGTPGYASPQRFAGEPLCVADDVHSFGGVLAFMLTAADPSHAPDRHHVLHRPIELLRPDAPAALAGLAARCLAPDPADRPASMAEVLGALAAVRTGPAARRRGAAARPVPARARTDRTDRLLRAARALARDLCARATPAEPDGDTRRTLVWQPSRDGRPVLRDANAGVAGIVVALAEVAPVLAEDCIAETLPAAARWLAASQPLPGGPLPGLYVGEAGVAAALLHAGTVLDDAALIEAASARSELVASLPHTSPDLYNGTAGRVRFHLLAWQVTGDEAELARALAGADHLAGRAGSGTDQTVGWPIPAGHEGPEEREYYGYAHGLAGIADVLVDVIQVTGEPRFRPLVQAAVASLAGTAQPTLVDGRGCSWPDGPGGDLMQPLWCHGGGGIARFLHRAGRLLADGEASALARRARRAAAAARMVGPSQCHGLAGTIEVLLDADDDPGAGAAAGELGDLLTCFLAPTDDLEPRSPLALRDDGLMTGRAGVLRGLVRLARPDRIGALLAPGEEGRDGRRG